LKAPVKHRYFLTFWVRIITVLTPDSHCSEENIPVRECPLPPENRRGWSRTVRIPQNVDESGMLTFLRVIPVYIGEIGGVETVPTRE